MIPCLALALFCLSIIELQTSAGSFSGGVYDAAKQPVNLSNGLFKNIFISQIVK